MLLASTFFPFHVDFNTLILAGHNIPPPPLLPLNKKNIPMFPLFDPNLLSRILLMVTRTSTLGDSLDLLPRSLNSPLPPHLTPHHSLVSPPPRSTLCELGSTQG